MKLTLISPFPDITVFGLRTISSHLKNHGHQTQLIFMPDPYGDDIIPGAQRYTDHIYEELISLCKDSDLIGITLMTNFFEGATQITQKLKRGLDIPIIWGGIHPTVRPEESLDYADIVCIGDGEDAILELVEKIKRGEDYLNTQNFWFKSDGKIIKNPLRPLSHNLDIYPIPDYSMEEHYILFEGHLELLSQELTKKFLEKGTVSAYINKIGYQTMTGRGCPHKCTYCANHALKNLYKGQAYFRWRSNEHVMEELMWVKENMPYIGYIWISDDAFFGRTLQNIRDFCIQYKQKIDLPFSCLASPLTITSEKMETLIDAGMIYMQVGIESGSRKMQELFNRKSMSNEKMMEAIEIINKYKDQMYPPSYDFLLDVPYETVSDKVESLKFISNIPKPFRLQPFSLVLYPGTELFQMVDRDGQITDERIQVYSKSWTMREPSYLNFLFRIARNGKLPGIILRFLVTKPIVSFFNSGLIKPVFEKAFRILQKIAKSIRK